ncbi:MAG: glutamate racemase [Candidatus Improbicoccus devescovinae]|nr:MAG: glutamate racemase [Candidatus Improbicoccus devescovinae]
MTKNNPLGVFDSGIGGLTLVKEIMKLLPHENIIYFGDIGRMPYGSKSPEIISLYASQIINFLKTKKVKFILSACGTVSTVILCENNNCEVDKSLILDNITKKNINKFNINLMGIVEASCAAAVKHTKNKKIGVIATETAVDSNRYEDIIKKIDPDIQVFQKGCPLLAPMIENRCVENNTYEFNNILKKYLSCLTKKNVDVIILGCTHYPVVKNLISKILPDIILIDPACETIIKLKQKLISLDLISTREETGNYIFFVSDIPDNFVKNAEIFLGKKIKKNVYFVDILKKN